MPESRHKIIAIAELRDNISNKLRTIQGAVKSTVDHVANFQRAFREAAETGVVHQKRLVESTKTFSGLSKKALNDVRRKYQDVIVTSSWMTKEGRHYHAVAKKVTEQTVEESNTFTKLGYIMNNVSQMFRKGAWASTWLLLSFLGLWFQARQFIKTVMKPFQDLLKIFQNWRRTLSSVAFAFGVASFFGISFANTSLNLQKLLPGLIKLGLKVQMLFGLIAAVLGKIGLKILPQVIDATVKLIKQFADYVAKNPKVLDAFTQLGIGIANFIKQLGPLIEKLPDILKGFLNLVDAIAPFVNSFGKATQLTINFLPIPPEMKSALNSLIAPLSNLTGNWQSLGSALASTMALMTMLSPVAMLMQTALNFLTVPLLLLSVTSGALSGLFARLGVAMLGMTPAAAEAAGTLGILKVALSSLLGPIGLVILAIGIFATMYATNFMGIRDATNKMVGEIILAIQKLAAFFAPVMGPALEYLKNIFVNAFTFIATFIGAIFKTIIDVVILITSALAGDWKTFWSTVDDITKTWSWNVKDSILNFLYSVGKAVVDFGTAVVTAWSGIFTELGKRLGLAISGLVGTITTGGKSLISGFIDGIKSLWDSYVNTVSNIVDEIKNGILNVINSAFQWGADLINSFINGIKSSIGNIGKTLGDIGGEIKKKLGFSLPESGPLRYVPQWGQHLIAEYAKSIERSVPNLERALERITATPTRVIERETRIVPGEIRPINAEINITTTGEINELTVGDLVRGIVNELRLRGVE